MGTSSSQGSPRRDSAWREVRDAYERGADPAETAALLAAAIPEETLGAFLEAATHALSSIGLDAGSSPEALAERLAQELGAENSLQREVANAAALRLAGKDLPADAVERARAHASELGAALTEYFVARDIEGLVGTDAIPDVPTADEVTEGIVSEVQRAILAADAPAADVATAELVTEILDAGLRRLREQGRGDA